MSAIQEVVKLTGHPFVELTPRGNTAIFCALYLAKKAGKTRVFIPDQGGWFTFKTYPKILGMDVEMIKTNEGIINHIPVTDNAVLLYTQPAGYFVEQDMHAIYHQCKGKTMVIVDVSGSIGSEMCRGEFGDILLGSFSEWKPINLGYGGFLSVKEKKILDYGKEILSLNKVSPHLEKELKEKIETLPQRYAFFSRHVQKIKKDLAQYDIVHREKTGINVVVGYRSEKEKKEIMEYCKNKNYPFTLCPRYIRVMKPAISIEVKRLV